MTQLYTTIKSFRESFNSKLKRINENVNDTYLHINLLDKYKESGDDILYKQQFEEYKQQLKGFKTVSEKTGLKTGDIIEFISGYNMDIKYITEILGFDEDDDIYLL
jgi:DNA polymerase II small subunit/DNA polymerase delta subunit B